MRKPVAETPLLSILGLSMWLGTAAVGVLGLVLPHPGESLSKKKDTITTAEIINVELTQDPLPELPKDQPKQQVIREPLPLEKMPEINQAPTLIPVANVALVQFALPVEGPTVEVPVAAAAPLNISPSPVATNPPAPQKLTFGLGEGKQPAPAYPYQAARQGQEGRVAVRFSVSENGRVSVAEVADPCPWPLLNEAAVKTIRERWKFAAGAQRFYEVSIRFELEK